MASQLSPTSVILTPRLYISRILAPRDCQFMIDLYNSDLFLKHNGKTGIDTHEKAEKHIEGWIASNFEKNGHGQYLISLRSAAGTEGDLPVGEAPVGMVSLMRGHYTAPDVGFALLPEHTGKGYATEAAKRMVQYATDPKAEPAAAAAAAATEAAKADEIIPVPEGQGLGLAGVFGFTARENENSKKACRRLGLEYRGIYALKAFGGENAVYAMPGMGNVEDYGITEPRLDSEPA